MATKANTKAQRKPRRTQEARSAGSSAGSSIDALELLEQDHREVEEMFDQYDELAGGDKRKQDLAQKICQALTIHTKIEEEIFYPAARKATKDDDLIDEAVVEHASVKNLIGEIEKMRIGDDLYDAKMRVLEEMVKRHVQEEEEELFPELASAGMDIAAVGQELARRKEERMKELQD